MCSVLFKEYVNKLDINETFTRLELFKSIYVKEVAIATIRYQSTIDQYRRWVSMGGCLKIIGYGKYKKLKNIPEYLSISKLRKHVYCNNWKSWYIQIENL